MRYYIYVDKQLLKNIYGTIDNDALSLEVVEYSVRKIYGKTSNFEVEPTFENGNEIEVETEKEDFKKAEQRKSKNSLKSKRKRNKKSNKTELKFNNMNSEETSFERRYTNIEDISEVKNISFFHNLIERVRGSSRTESRIYFGEGTIYPCKLKESFRYNESKLGKNSLFVRQENTFIWLNESILGEDIFTISNITNDIGVIGYIVRDLIHEDFKIAKAIALYI